MCFNIENVGLIVESRGQFKDMMTSFKSFKSMVNCGVLVIVVHNPCVWVWVVGKKSTDVFGSSKVEIVVLEKV